MNGAKTKLEVHLKQLTHVQLKEKRKVALLVYIQWFVIMLTGVYVLQLFALHRAYWQVVIEFEWLLSSAIITAAGLGLVLLFGIILVCEFYRDTLDGRVGISELRLDNLVATHDAIREYLGTALPEHQKHLNGFGLSSEIYAVSEAMSAQYTRSYTAVSRAMQLLEEMGGLASVKHETVKAKALNELLQNILTVLSDCPEVTEATTADRELGKTVVAFKKMIAAE